MKVIHNYKPLVEQATEELRMEIERIRVFAESHPEDEFVKANEYLLGADPKVDKSSTATGALQFIGTVAWSLSAQFAFLDPIGATKFLAAKGGPSWAAGAFSSVIGGTFAVDPSDLPQRVRFSLSAAGVKAGGVHLHIYDMSRMYLGTFAGVAVPSIVVASVSGSGRLTSPRTEEQ